jgi:DTW domain-containing protein YfiP
MEKMLRKAAVLFALSCTPVLAVDDEVISGYFTLSDEQERGFCTVSGSSRP